MKVKFDVYFYDLLEKNIFWDSNCVRLYNIFFNSMGFASISGKISPSLAPAPTPLLFSLLLSSSAESYLAEEEKNLKSRGPTTRVLLDSSGNNSDPISFSFFNHFNVTQNHIFRWFKYTNPCV